MTQEWIEWIAATHLKDELESYKEFCSGFATQTGVGAAAPKKISSK